MLALLPPDHSQFHDDDHQTKFLRDILRGILQEVWSRLLTDMTFEETHVESLEGGFLFEIEKGSNEDLKPR